MSNRTCKQAYIYNNTHHTPTLKAAVQATHHQSYLSNPRATSRWQPHHTYATPQSHHTSPWPHLTHVQNAICRLILSMCTWACQACTCTSAEHLNHHILSCVRLNYHKKPTSIPSSCPYFFASDCTSIYTRSTHPRHQYHAPCLPLCSAMHTHPLSIATATCLPLCTCNQYGKRTQFAMHPLPIESANQAFTSVRHMYT